MYYASIKYQVQEVMQRILKEMMYRCDNGAAECVQE